METVIFPDTEAVVVKFLNAELDVHVGTKVPATRPDSFVRIRLSGGQRRNKVLDMPTVTVEAWANTEAAAAALIQKCRGLLNGADRMAGTPVYRVQEFSSPTNFPDTDTDQYRYTITLAIGLRGVKENDS